MFCLICMNIPFCESNTATGRQGEIGGYWYSQTEIVEVWEEKVDLVGNFAELLRPKHFLQNI